MVLSILRRFKRKQKPEGVITETLYIESNVGSSHNGILSHDAAAIGSWVQSMQGVTIDAVHGSMFSHNYVTIISAPNANDDQDYIDFKVRDIILKPREIHTRYIHQDLQSDGTLVSTGDIHEFNVEVVQSPRQFKIWKYERGAIESQWKKDLDVFRAVKHQNIIQLYGFCRSPMLTALVFHDFQRSTRSPAYHLTLSRMAFTTYWPHRAKEFESVADSLATHRLVPHDALLDYQMVNNEGYLIVDRFQHHNHGPTWKLRFRVPSPRRSLAMTSKSKSISHLNSPLQSMMAMANKFMSGQFVQSHLSDYYNYLEEICTPHFGSSRNVTFCITELQTTATTFHISTTPFRFKLVAFKEDVKTECLSGLRLQFTIAISSLNPSFIFDQRYWLLVADSMKASSDSGKGGLSPFSIWASQAHYIIQAQGINPTRIQTAVPYATTIYLHCFNRKSINQHNLSHPFMKHDMIHLVVDCGSRPCSWCWSTDPAGQEVIPHRDVENALGLHIDIFTQMWHYNVPPQLYPILRQIHETCGFNPDSTEMAEYLGYPLLETSFEGESSESDTTISASEMLTRESSEIGSDDESENGSTSSDDTFLSADSKI